MTATTHTAEVPVFKMIPRSNIRPSPQNPRKKMRGLEELTQSVKDKGVLHPLLVRPVGDTKFEIVAGERRWHAGGAAELEELPCIVREMDAVTALELALVENLERNDLSPMEEGRAFELLMSGYKRSVEDVASKVGRSVGYVRQRLRFTRLHTSFAALLDTEKLDVGAAMVLAQIPEKSQAEIAKRCVPDWTKRDQVSRRDIQDAIRGYSHALAQAPFHAEDPQLVPAAGPCGACPKRTGRQGILFVAFVTEVDTCLDADCWSSKVTATWKLREAEAKKAGVRVLTTAEAKKYLQHGRTAWDAPFVALDHGVYVGNKTKTVAELVGPDAPRILGRCPDTGATIDLIEKKLLEAATAVIAKDAKKAERAKPATKTEKADNDAETREREKAKHRKAVSERVRLMVCAQVAGAINIGKLPIEKALRVLVADAAHQTAGAKFVAERRGYAIPEGSKSDDYSDEALALMNEAAVAKEPRVLVGIIVELMAFKLVSVGPYVDHDETPPELVGLGVDLKRFEAVAAQEIRDEKKGKTKPKAEKAKPAAPTPTAAKTKAKRAA